MDGNFFFVVGIVLVACAVGLAFVGIRGSESFPPSRPVFAGIIGLFAAIVATTMAFAIVKSNDEQKSRNEKLAAEEGTTTTAAGGGKTTDLSVSSPADGGLSYSPNGLQAQPGNVTISYDNPSQVPHSIAVATSNGNVLGEVQPFTAGKQSVSLSNLAPGKYVFYCTVPGHREAGMQGDLTVLASKGAAGSGAPG
jgi:plastocyanin